MSRTLVVGKTYLDKCERLFIAVRAMIYAQDFKPGEDLGAEASAKCWVELRSAAEAIGISMSRDEFEKYIKTIR